MKAGHKLKFWYEKGPKQDSGGSRQGSSVSTGKNEGCVCARARVYKVAEEVSFHKNE